MLRVVELFAGIGAQATALENLGIEHQCKTSEIDERAVRMYNAIHGETENLGDITKVEHLPECDLVTWSFPCCAKGTLVLTTDGWMPIEEVRPGDMVWTDRCWCEVVASERTGTKPVRVVKPSCGLEIRATGNHPFLVRRRWRVWNANRRSYDRVFGAPEWVAAEDLTKDMYLGYRIPDEGGVPMYTGYSKKYSDGRMYVRNDLGGMMEDESFWWTVGRYLADGYINSAGGAVFCLGKGKEGDAERIPFHYTLSKERTCLKAIVSKVELGRFLSEFGCGAENKHIPPAYRSIPRNLAKAMLEGYLAGDGHFDEEGRTWRSTTVSKSLALDIAHLVAYVHWKPASITVCRRAPTYVIEGRTVNQRDTYTVRFHEDGRIQDKAFCEDGWIWMPITRMEWSGAEDVYDLEVADRHCFTANGAIVHNCQDLSVAGRQRGMEEGSGTRSSLGWEVIRLVRDAVERGHPPKWLLMENVPAITFRKNLPEFNRIIDALRDLGYVSSWKILNAKDFGVPQNRARCFMVSEHGADRLFEFPEGFPLEIRLKDVLEKDVPESYYLSEERIATYERQEENGRNFGWKPVTADGVMNAVTTVPERHATGNYVDETVVAGSLDIPGRYESALRVYGTEGTAPTLPTGSGGGIMPKIEEPTIEIADRLDNGSQQNGAVYDADGISPALMASAGEKGNHVRIVEEPSIIMAGHLTDTAFEQAQRVYDTDGIAPAMKARDFKEPSKIQETQVIFAGNLKSGSQYNQATQVLDSDGISPALTTTHPGIGLPKVEDSVPWPDGSRGEDRPAYEGDGVKIYPRPERGGGTVQPQSTNALNTYRGCGSGVVVRESEALPDIPEGGVAPMLTPGREEKRQNGRRFKEDGDDSFTVTTSDRHGVATREEGRLRIRYLTERECWRLMGFDDERIDRAFAVEKSKSARYKAAGNSIVVPVLEAIFRRMYLEQPPARQTTLRRWPRCRPASPRWSACSDATYGARRTPRASWSSDRPRSAPGNPTRGSASWRGSTERERGDGMLTVYLRIAGQSNEIMAGYAPDMEHAEAIRDIAVGSYAARGIEIQSTRIAGEPADKPITHETKE